VSATFLETRKESLLKERKKWGGGGKVNMLASENKKELFADKVCPNNQHMHYKSTSPLLFSCSFTRESLKLETGSNFLCK